MPEIKHKVIFNTTYKDSCFLKNNSKGLILKYLKFTIIKLVQYFHRTYILIIFT